MEPGISQAVPRIGVALVSGDELTVERPGFLVLITDERPVGIDHRALVRRQVCRVGGGPEHETVRYGILNPGYPAPSQRQRVVSQAEGGIGCNSSLKVALGGH